MAIVNCVKMWNTWPVEAPKWTQKNYEDLMEIHSTEQFPKVTLEQITANSDKFPVAFPIESVRCKSLISKTPEEILERNINSAYPVVHEYTVNLYLKFLENKRKFGSAMEREVYKGMSLETLVDRLLTKRAVSFVGPYDRYRLLTDDSEEMRIDKWELIGSEKEEEPMTLQNCLSYDEIKLSALLSVSSYTQFINSGHRSNCGKIEEDKNKIEDNGIIMGLIGTRLHKSGVMEYQEIVVTKEQNVAENGYGTALIPTIKSIFLNVYGEAFQTYSQLKKQLKDEVKFMEIMKGTYFNNMVYERRLALSIDTLLVEANERARACGKMAYLHVVGFGLGVWRISQHQNKMFMNAFARRIEFLGPTLHCIDAICFSYIKHQYCGTYKNGDVIPIEEHPNNGISILIADQNPHEKLKHPYKGHLLVVSYAWDGNALPGNEFWWGNLSTSGDPAAACSTQVAEVHNAHINPAICGANLRIATLNGLLTLKEYQLRVEKEPNKYGKLEKIKASRCLLL